MGMDSFNSILLCVDVAARGFDADESPPLEVVSAISKANWIREQSGASVTIQAVVEGEDVDAETLDLARLRLKDSVLSRLDGEAQLVVSQGSAFVEIIRQVLRDKHDLVIVAARKSSLVHRTLVGSVALNLLRKCPCPVWVTPRRSDPGERVVLSAVAMHDLTSSVLELSAAIVKLRGGKWNVFHCPEYPREGGMRLRCASVQETEEYEAGVRKEAWKQLHEMCDPLAEETGVTPKLYMSEGLPSEQISLAVRELGADLLVLGTIGRAGIAGRLIGNTAEKALATIECSILAMKPDGFETPVTLD